MNVGMIPKKILRETTCILGRVLPRSNPMAPRILNYHGVRPSSADPWSVQPKPFLRHMEKIIETRLPVPIMEIVSWVTGGPIPAAGSVSVTFDHGGVDIYEHAAPVLSDQHLPGAVFIRPDLADLADRAQHSDTGKWHRRDSTHMSWPQIRELHAAGWTIAAQAPVLKQRSKEGQEALFQTMRRFRRQIEENTGERCELLSYPYNAPGRIPPTILKLGKRAGYRATFANSVGLPRPGDDPHALARSQILGCDSFHVYKGSLIGAMDLWKLFEQR
ncbi:MAG: polysaccharide deacetylase family protein [Magnetococcales bacterium]|nr:polysaccharide deacetylase family protein [Magnetococcales bacterium]